MAQPRKPAAVKAWLATRPGLDELRAEYPAEWTVTERELMAIFEGGDRSALDDYVRALADPAPPRPGEKAATPGLDPKVAQRIRQLMAAEAVRGLGVRAATGVTSDRVRFGKVNGWIAQRLLFQQGLVRKPVSNRWFGLVWPLLTQRKRLMPLVQPRGIYCFYSRALVRELATLIGDRPALEIAAGDGTLSRFLQGAGVAVTATDDHSWTAVAFPEGVAKLDARKALRKHAPEVVLCSWPPAGNDFEAAVFATPSVETYIVIGNRHAPGWGNHGAYEQQTDFTQRIDHDLGRLALPPELESVVVVFEREPERPAPA